MKRTGKWFKKVMALTLVLTLTLTTNFMYSDVKADATVQEGAKKAVHLTAQKLRNAINVVESASTAWDGTTVKEPERDEDNNNLLYISDASELAWLSGTTNDGDNTKYSVELTDDINLNNKPWTRIAKFSGTFNGNGHRIYNLNVNDGDFQGLFKKIKGYSKKYPAEIKDLTVEGKVTTKGSKVGGIAAEIEYTNVKNVTTNIEVSGNETTGGMFGTVRFANLENCINLGNVVNNRFIIGEGDVGGITGEAYYSTFNNCGNEGNVGYHTDYAGGIAGRVNVYTRYEDEITNCYNTGEIVGYAKVGGIVGSFLMRKEAGYSAVSYIKNVYNTGNIKALYDTYTDSAVAGGIVGEIKGPSTVLMDSYNGGKVYCEKLKGSVVGTVKDATLTNVYSLTNEGTPLYNVASYSTTESIEKIEYKDKEWFTSDGFKTAMGENAGNYECREAYINRGLPVFTTQNDTIEEAVREAKKYINRTISEVGYKGLSKTAVDNITKESIAKIEQLTDKTAIGQEVSSAEEAIKAIPNEVNYGLDLTKLNERVAYANSLDSSKYTEDTWKKVEAELNVISYYMEEGFETQEAVDGNLETLSMHIANLVLVQESTTEPSIQPTTKPSTQPTTKPSTQLTTKPSTQLTTKPSIQLTTKPSTTQPNTTNNVQPTTVKKDVKVATAKLKSVKNSKKKKLSVKWIKISKVNGYQIRYATNKNFKKAKIFTTKKNVSAATLKATNGKKYYVQVRAYIRTKDGIVYGNWSNKKAAKVRK